MQREDKKKKIILLVVNEPGEFTELIRVAKACSANEWAIAFLFPNYGYINIKRDCAACDRQGFYAYYPEMEPIDQLEAKLAEDRERPLKGGYYPNSLLKGGEKSNKLSRWKLILLIISLAPLLFLRRYLTRSQTIHSNHLYLRSLLFSLKIYKLVKPSIVIFGQEFPGSPNSLITQHCNKAGIPTLIVPFDVGTTKEMVESLHDKKDHWINTNLINRMAGSLFPHWVNYYHGRKLLRLPGQSILMLELLKITPPHPWIPNSSHVSKIAVESEIMMKYYADMHFPPEQLAETGATYDDIITTARDAKTSIRAATAEKFNLDLGKKWLVCAWPTNQYSTRNNPIEFTNYEQLCHAWASALRAVAMQTDFEVIICPHPVSDITYVRNVLSLYGLSMNITTNRTLDMVCCSDLFVACVSSTIRWAISLGVPVINYDCYDYGYTDFDVAGGVSTVTQSVDFESQLMRLTKNQTLYDAARRAQAECAAQWGFHDGKSTLRILSLIDKLTMETPT